MTITLENMAFSAFIFRNNLHHLHHNISGKDFLDTHEYFGDLYDKALEDADFFAEHAIINKEVECFPNFNLVAESEVNELTTILQLDSPISIEQGYEKLSEIGEDYLDALELCREYCEKEELNDIVSKIDDIYGFWSTEIEYKVKRTISK